MKFDKNHQKASISFINITTPEFKNILKKHPQLIKQEDIEYNEKSIFLNSPTKDLKRLVEHYFSHFDDFSENIELRLIKDPYDSFFQKKEDQSLCNNLKKKVKEMYVLLKKPENHAAFIKLAFHPGELKVYLKMEKSNYTFISKFTKNDANMMLEQFNMIQDLEPEFNKTKDIAIYNFPNPIEGHKNIKFKKINNCWYLKLN